jgi:hypothetical protein
MVPLVLGSIWRLKRLMVLVVVRSKKTKIAILIIELNNLINILKLTIIIDFKLEIHKLKMYKTHNKKVNG